MLVRVEVMGKMGVVGEVVEVGVGGEVIEVGLVEGGVGGFRRGGGGGCGGG